MLNTLCNRKLKSDCNFLMGIWSGTNATLNLHTCVFKSLCAQQPIVKVIEIEKIGSSCSTDLLFLEPAQALILVPSVHMVIPALHAGSSTLNRHPVRSFLFRDVTVLFSHKRTISWIRSPLNYKCLEPVFKTTWLWPHRQLFQPGPTNNSQILELYLKRKKSKSYRSKAMIPSCVI